MHLLTDPWIPTGDGRRVTLHDAYALPRLAIRTHRPDLDFALLMLAIGLRQTGFDPPPLFGDGPRFLQSPAALAGRQIPVRQILLDASSENALRKNAAIFRPPETGNGLCPPCVTLALYVRIEFGGAIGSGFFPGPLCNQLLYVIARTTLGETVEANTIDAPVAPEAYFAVTNDYWLEAPNGTGECAVCGENGPVVQSYWRKKKPSKPNYPPNPHAGRTAKNKLYGYYDNMALMDVIEGAAPDSVTCIQPPVLRERARIGERIAVFCAMHDRAAIARLFSTEFHMRSRMLRWPIKNCVESIWKLRYPKSIPFDLNHGMVGEIRTSVSDHVLAGLDEKSAALQVFDDYCPEPHWSDNRKYPIWKSLRNRISKYPDPGHEVDEAEEEVYRV